MSLFQSLIVVALIIAASNNEPCCDKFSDTNITQVREIEPFSGVVNAGNFHMTLIQDSIWSVQVRGTENQLDAVVTSVYDNQLTVYTKNHFLKSTPSLEIVVTAPDFNKIKMAGSGSVYASNILTDQMEIIQLGSGNIKIDELYASGVNLNLAGSGNIRVNQKCADLEVDVAGSGNIMLSGYAEKSDYKIAGSGKIAGKGLVNDYCEANILGSGNLHTTVRGKLYARICGSGSVFYYGNPEVEKEISGSGNVMKIID